MADDHGPIHGGKHRDLAENMSQLDHKNPGTVEINHFTHLSKYLWFSKLLHNYVNAMHSYPVEL